MKRNKQKNRNKSVIGVIQFVFSSMERRDKSIFILLAIFYGLSGIFRLIPAQVLSMLISYLTGNGLSFFGLKIDVNFSITLIIILCAIISIIPKIITHIMGYYENKFVQKLYLQCKQTAFSWATTPRKNLDLGMTIGDATYRINDSIVDIEWSLACLFDTILPSIFSAIVSAIYVCLIDIMALPVLAIGMTFVIITFLVRQRVENPITQRMELRGARITNFLVNTLGNLTLINLSNSRKYENDNLKNRVDDYRNVSKSRYKIWSVYWTIMCIIDVLCTYSIIMIASSKATSGLISASDIVIVISYVEKVFSPVQDFGWFINTNTQLYTKIERLK